MAPSKKISPSKNKEYCKRYREKNSEKAKEADRLRKQHSRFLPKVKGGVVYEELKRKNRERMRLKRLKQKKENQTELPTTPILENPTLSFSSKQTRARSVKRAEKSLPESPRKRVEIIGNLAKKYKIRIAPPSRGRKSNVFDEEQIIWFMNFLERPDITLTNSGTKDSVYTGKIDGVSQFVQKQYLLWSLKDLHEIINGNEVVGIDVSDQSYADRFDEKLSFANMYGFLKSKKQFIWNRNIPEFSCLCEVCENVCLFARGINKKLKLSLPTNPHGLVEENSCDSNESSCMTGTCENCKLPARWASFEEYSSDSESESDGDISFFKWVKVDKQVTKAQINMSRDEAWEKWCSSIDVLKSHIHRKRKQNEFYNELKRNLNKNDCIIQVDYSESYCNKQQGEIQSAYFGHTNFSIFTVCGYFRKETSSDLTKVPITIVSEAKDQSRIASHACVSKVIECVEEQMPIANYLNRVIIWSDGCSAQFRSRFTFSILVDLYPAKTIEWNYNEAHHGKGPMDGIGGTIKNKVYQNVKSGKLVIHTPKEFSEAAKSLIPSITIYLPEAEIPSEQPDRESPAIPGTLQVHQIIRKKNNQGVWYLEFYKLSSDEEPFYKQFYRKGDDPVVCGHDDFDGGDNKCAACKVVYIQGGEWIECPVCKNWYCGEECFSL